MSRHCATSQCSGPGVIYIAKGRYLCANCAATATPPAMPEPPAITEPPADLRAEQLNNANSLEAIYPELGNPDVLAAHVAMWNELDRKAAAEEAARRAQFEAFRQEAKRRGDL